MQTKFLNYIDSFPKDILQELIETENVYSPYLKTYDFDHSVTVDKHHFIIGLGQKHLLGFMENYKPIEEVHPWLSAYRIRIVLKEILENVQSSSLLKIAKYPSPDNYTSNVFSLTMNVCPVFFHISLLEHGDTFEYFEYIEKISNHEEIQSFDPDKRPLALALNSVGKLILKNSLGAGLRIIEEISNRDNFITPIKVKIKNDTALPDAKNIQMRIENADYLPIDNFGKGTLLKLSSFENKVIKSTISDNTIDLYYQCGLVLHHIKSYTNYLRDLLSNFKSINVPENFYNIIELMIAKSQTRTLQPVLLTKVIIPHFTIRLQAQSDKIIFTIYENNEVYTLKDKIRLVNKLLNNEPLSKFQTKKLTSDYFTNSTWIIDCIRLSCNYDHDDLSLQDLLQKNRGKLQAYDILHDMVRNEKNTAVKLGKVIRLEF